MQERFNCINCIPLFGKKYIGDKPPQGVHCAHFGYWEVPTGMALISKILMQETVSIFMILIQGTVSIYSNFVEGAGA